MMFDWHYPAAFAVAYLIGWLLGRVRKERQEG